MIPGRRLRAQKNALRSSISAEIEAESVLPPLARRIALQLVLKVHAHELRDRSVWRAIGRCLREETRRLRNGVRLVERNIVVGLPKLSAEQIENLLEDLEIRDPTIARTILNVALDAAEPLSAGPRYMSEYHRVARQFQGVDASLARTLANTTFMAHSPWTKAMNHFSQFADLVAQFRDDVPFVRTLAKASCRAPDPLQAARIIIAHYESTMAALVSEGVQRDVARTVAGITCRSKDERARADTLLRTFKQIFRLAMETHPAIAHSVALSAWRAADPLRAARAYMKNHENWKQVRTHTRVSA